MGFQRVRWTEHQTTNPLAHLSGKVGKTPNVNTLIGISLVQAEKPIVMEEKSPNPPPINLWLLEARAHHINRGPGLRNELGKGETVTGRISEVENSTSWGPGSWPPSLGVSPLQQEDACWVIPRAVPRGCRGRQDGRGQL